MVVDAAIRPAAPATIKPKPVYGSAEEAVAAARALAPVIASRAEQTEADRCVPDESVAALVDAGLFDLLTPRCFGGSELGFDALLAADAVLAEACAATGWVYGVLAGHTWLLSLFPAPAQEAVFSDPRALVASLIRLGGASPVAVDGGFRWQGGTGRFCSGVDHADWVMVGGAVADGSVGTDDRFFLLERKDFRVVDDWYSVGLRGTGSKSIIVNDAFIPENRSVRFADMVAGRAPGTKLHANPIYRLPFRAGWPFSLAGTPIGAARAAAEMYRSAQVRKAAGRPVSGSVAQRYAEASASIDAGYELLRATTVSLNDVRSADDLPAGAQARVARNLAYGVKLARTGLNQIFEGSGGSGVYTTEAVQRAWRDGNTAASHIAFNWDVHGPAFGQAATAPAPVG